MSIFSKLKQKIQASTEEHQSGTDGLLVIAITMNRTLKVVQITYPLGQQEIDMIEGMLELHQEGMQAAVEYFFPVGRPGPAQLPFVRFLDYAVLACLTTMEEPREQLQETLDSLGIPLSTSGKRRRGQLAAAEQMLFLAGAKRLREFGMARDRLQLQVSLVLVSLLQCIETLIKEKPSLMIDMLAGPFKLVQKNREVFGPEITKWLEKVEFEPAIQQCLERYGDSSASG
jgi:hypothetical protein